MTTALAALVLIMAMVVFVLAIKRMATDRRSEARQVLAAVAILMLLHIGMKLYLIFPMLEVAPEYVRLYWNTIDVVNLLVVFALIKLVARKQRTEVKPLE